MKRGKLIALAGVATTGALAYWKYRNLSSEQKENLKSKVKSFVSPNRSNPVEENSTQASAASTSTAGKTRNGRKVSASAPVA